MGAFEVALAKQQKTKFNQKALTSPTLLYILTFG